MRFIFNLILGLIAALGPAAAGEPIDIPQTDLTLHGMLFHPAGAGPFPSVVALHGCESLMDRSGKLAPLFDAWGERLAAAGLAAVFPDSFGSRGLRTQCRLVERKVRSEHERVADADAARRWLQTQPWAIKERVSLVGWAAGGVASLWAVRPRTLPHDGMPDFRSAVALYPACREVGRACLERPRSDPDPDRRCR